MVTTLTVLHPKGGGADLTTIVEPAVAASVRSAKREATPVVLAVLHPKGGVGRSTTVWQLGRRAGAARQARADRGPGQGRHLSRVFERHPLGLERLYLASSSIEENDADLALLDTAPEAQRERALGILRRADWLLVPVKGPEEGSAQALPALLRWLPEADGARLLGFLPTMHKPRCIEVRYWLGELHRLAERHQTRVFEPIGDLACVAAWRLDGRPYARVAEEILRATNSA